MKAIEELIGLFPEQSFREVFESRITELKSRAGSDEAKQNQIKDIENSYKQLCDLFDGTIEKLRDIIKKYSDHEIDDFLADEIEKVIREYATQVQKMVEVDIGTPEINQASQAFNQSVANIFSTYVRNNEKSSAFKTFVFYAMQSIQLLPILSGKKAEEYNEALSTIQKVIKKKKSFESAIEVAESLMEKREPLIEQDVEKKIDQLSDKAKLHNERKIWLWFASGCGLGVLAVIALWKIILAFSEEATFGEAMLRLGLVSVILYFAFYCIKQFSIHRHLFQLYSFKAISLRVMLDLRGEMDDLEKKLVLAKGLEAIFNEPATGLAQQQTDHAGDYWQSVQRILERLVTKNSDS